MATTGIQRDEELGSDWGLEAQAGRNLQTPPPLRRSQETGPQRGGHKGASSGMRGYVEWEHLGWRLPREGRTGASNAEVRPGSGQGTVGQEEASTEIQGSGKSELASRGLGIKTPL